jgi:hypothetical protein
MTLLQAIKGIQQTGARPTAAEAAATAAEPGFFGSAEGLAALGAGGAAGAARTAWSAAHPVLKGLFGIGENVNPFKHAGAIGGQAAGIMFGLNLLADYVGSKMEGGKQTQKLARAIGNPRELTMDIQENLAETETAKAMEAARINQLRTQVAGQDPKMYQLLHSLAAGDAFPRLGPGEARVGGSSLISNDVLDKAIANSDIWDLPRGSTLFGRVE